MGWKPRQWTRTQLEARRLDFAQMIHQSGWSHQQLCQYFGVSRSCLYQWKRILREQGTEGLRAKVAKGPQRLITPEQENQLKKWLQEDATEHGFPDPTWTSRRARDLIGLKFDVWYHADHVYKILVWLGFSYQKPEKRAIERDEPRITTWKREVIPEVHRLMEQDHILVFMDETVITSHPFCMRAGK